MIAEHVQPDGVEVGELLDPVEAVHLLVLAVKLQPDRVGVVVQTQHPALLLPTEQLPLDLVLSRRKRRLVVIPDAGEVVGTHPGERGSGKARILPGKVFPGDRNAVEEVPIARRRVHDFYDLVFGRLKVSEG